MSSSLFLSLRAATFRLGETLVFPGSNWEFRADEHWVVVGPNGSGKSLFADALRGFLPLVSGSLLYHFRPAAGLEPSECIGVVSFHGRKEAEHDTVTQSRWNSIEEEATLTAAEWLSYDRVMEVNPFEVTSRHDRQRPGFDKRRRKAVFDLEVGLLLSRRLLSLSNGERQRVELARALCRPLRLLILDEPFAGLDILSRERLHRMLGRLMRTPLRLLILTTRAEDIPAAVTHQLHVAECRLRKSETRNPKPERSSKAESRRGGNAFGVRQGHLGTAAVLRGKSKPPRELVVLREATVQYGAKRILDRLSWTVNAGESWALLGPNGSGKSTLLSLITGDNPQVYANDVMLFGRRLGDGISVWDLKRRTGIVSPELHLHYDDMVRCRNVVVSGFAESIGVFEQPTSRQHAAASQWLVRFGLTEFADTPLCALSAGLQRMVLLARALVKDPELLILDEPCQGLDLPHRRLFIKTVDGLIRHGGVAAIYVSHRADEIPPSIKNVLELAGRTGRVRAGLEVRRTR